MRGRIGRGRGAPGRSGVLPVPHLSQVTAKIIDPLGLDAGRGRPHLLDATAQRIIGRGGDVAAAWTLNDVVYTLLNSNVNDYWIVIIIVGTK